jgi:6-phosphofructokinase 1
MSLERLQNDIGELRAGFAQGKRRGLIVRNEHADEFFTSTVLRALLEHESSGEFDVRTAVLGPVQHGGRPSPFDRLQATRLVSAAVDHLVREADKESPESAMVGLRAGKVAVTPLSAFQELVDPEVRRPRAPQWWLALRDVAEVMSSSSVDAADDRRHR